MREHDKSADMPMGYAANQNQRPIRVLWFDGHGWNVEHVYSPLEAEALSQQFKQMGHRVETHDPNEERYE